MIDLIEEVEKLQAELRSLHVQNKVLRILMDEVRNERDAAIKKLNGTLLKIYRGDPDEC